MSDQTTAGGNAGAQAADPTPRDLASLFAEARQPSESADDATEEVNSAPEAVNADPPQEAHGEETETPEPQPEAEPIEPPRFWTKEAKDRWSSLPRETQEYIASREQERDREVRRSQNEAAEQRKAIEADRQKAEQVRNEYEGKLPALMQALHDVNAEQFGDVRSLDDVTRLAAEDPFRYLQWQAHQSKMAAVQQELNQTEQRKSQEAQNEWATYTQEQDTKFAESLSAADKAKLTDLMGAAPTFLTERGFTQNELAKLWSENKLFRDHRIQSLVLDAMKYRDLQKAPPKAIPKPVPKVQQPGTAKPAGSAASETIQNLSAKLDRTRDPKDLGNLIGALRRTG